MARAEWDAGDMNIAVFFNEKMDTRPPTTNVVIRVFDGVNSQVVTYGPNANIAWATSPERLSSDDVTSTAAYTGPSHVEIIVAGNVRAYRRFTLPNGSRTHRVDFI